MHKIEHQSTLLTSKLKPNMNIALCNSLIFMLKLLYLKHTMNLLRHVPQSLTVFSCFSTHTNFICRNGCLGSSLASYPAVYPFLTCIPFSKLMQGSAMEDILDSIVIGAQNLSHPQSQASALASCYLECFQYFLKTGLLSPFLLDFCLIFFTFLSAHTASSSLPLVFCAERKKRKSNKLPGWQFSNSFMHRDHVSIILTRAQMNIYQCVKRDMTSLNEEALVFNASISSQVAFALLCNTRFVQCQNVQLILHANARLLLYQVLLTIFIDCRYRIIQKRACQDHKREHSHSCDMSSMRVWFLSYFLKMAGQVQCVVDCWTKHYKLPLTQVSCFSLFSSCLIKYSLPWLSELALLLHIFISYSKFSLNQRHLHTICHLVSWQASPYDGFSLKDLSLNLYKIQSNIACEYIWPDRVKPHLVTVSNTAPFYFWIRCHPCAYPHVHTSIFLLAVHTLLIFHIQTKESARL